MEQSILYTTDYPITKDIVVHVPTVREIVKEYGEDEYYSLISYFLATSYDLMLDLEDNGIDYETVSDFDVFLMRFEDFKQQNTSILFPGLDFSQFNYAQDTNSGNTVVWNGDDIVIDDVIYWQIAQFLRRLTQTKRNYLHMGNKEGKRYTLEKLRKARRRQQRNASNRKTTLSFMEQCIIALVNASEFKYNYETVLDLTLFQFNASVKQIQHRVHCDYMATGVFMGAVDLKGNPNRLNWMMSEDSTG